MVDAVEEKCHVFMMPDDLSGTESMLQILKLKHPRTGTPLCCIMESNKLFEVVKYAERYSSWFVGDMVVEDGSLYLVTPMDPVFLILPYMYKESRFCPIQDMVVDDTYPDAKHLQDCCQHDDLLNIAKSKDVMNLKVYSYDENKTLNWLKRKVEQVVSNFQEKEMCINDGSKAENYNPTSKEDFSKRDYKQIACHLISEYVNDDLAGKLCSSFGYPVLCDDDENEDSVQQQQKKNKTEEEIMPLEDYSNNATPLSQDKNKTKFTASQKKLHKADKTGMKSISSFFQKK